MVAAEGARGLDRAIVEARPQPDADARRAGYRLDTAHQHGRPVDAAELPEARREIDDPDSAARGIGKDGRENRRVAFVVLSAVGEVLDADIEESRAVLAGPVVEQAAEYRIAVEARPA